MADLVDSVIPNTLALIIYHLYFLSGILSGDERCDSNRFRLIHWICYCANGISKNILAHTTHQHNIRDYQQQQSLSLSLVLTSLSISLSLSTILHHPTTSNFPFDYNSMCYFHKRSQTPYGRLLFCTLLLSKQLTSHSIDLNTSTQVVRFASSCLINGISRVCLCVCVCVCR